MSGTPSGREATSTPAAPAIWRRVSWGAIWAGMFVTVVLVVMFTFLGVACGISTLNPYYNPRSAPAGFSVGAMIWLMVSWLISIWAGARVGGWMSGGPRRADGTVHGVVVWSFAAAVILLLLTGATGTFTGRSGGLLSWNRQNHPTITSAVTPPSGTALTPTGRTESPAQAANAGAATAQHTHVWGKALWGFIALVLGLGVAAWGGAAGAAASERSLNATMA